MRIGGGENQRLALYDGILIKENHIAAAGSITAAMQAALALGTDASVQIEVESIAELEEALAAGAKSVLIDNFTSADDARSGGNQPWARAAGGVGRVSMPRRSGTSPRRAWIGSRWAS